MEGRDRLERLLDAPGADVPAAARAAALDGLAGVLYWQGDYGRAAELYKQSMGIYRASGDRAKVVETLWSISLAHHLSGDSAAALPYAEESLKMARVIGDANMTKIAAGHVGAILAFTGHYDDAVPMLRGYISGARNSGNKLYEAIGIQLLGWIRLQQGDVDEALAAYFKGLDILQKLGDRTAVAMTLNRLADLAIEQQQLPRALRLAGAAEAIRRKHKGGASPEAGHVRDPRRFADEVLGADAAADEWRKGLAMSYEAALEYARRPAD